MKLAMNLFAGFGRRHLVIAAAFAVVTQLTHTAYVVLGQEQFELIPVIAWTGMYLLLFLAGLGCAVATENRLGLSARGIIVAVLAAALLATFAVELLLYAMPANLLGVFEGSKRETFLNDFHRIAFRFSASAGWSVLLVVFYAMLRASERAAEQLHAAQVAALAAERQVVEGDLRAMQGRVDPQLLFDTLLQVERAYAHDVQAGQEALDALIRFLRAALPGDPAASTTVAGERELTEAYLGLLASRADSRPQINISVAPEANSVAMPAMLLLPLVRWALDDRSATQLEISARRRADALEVSVRSDSRASAPAGEAHIAGVRERLARLFAGQAKLDVNISPEARYARLLIPT
jgi:hypothetical protein